YGDDTRFPVYPCIQPNVRFWTQVYTEYPTTQGILHDSENLNVIYEVIELIHPDKYHAKRINEKRINAAKHKYRIILKKLSQNPSASDDEAKRIAALFGEEGSRAAFRKAMYKIRCQVGQKDRFREGIIRSGAYIDQMKQMFRSYGLPIDLVYIPHVESSFNPRAYSKRGAAGIWQFVREAGKRTMTVGYALDERWDPIRSSEAAAQLLKRSYEKFGSWPMAITAYNHGIAGVLKAKWKKGTYENIFKYYKGNRFRFASRNFYSEFLAAREAATNREKYFGDIVPDPPADSRKISLAGYASIKDLARYFDVDIDILARLNPSLRPPVFKEQKYVPAGYALRLPAGALQKRTGDSMEIPPEMYKTGQKSSRIYRVKKGDSITKIAEMNGISVTDLFVANKLNSKGTIYVNQNLRLPLPGEAADLSVPSYTSPTKIHRQKVQSSETTSGPLSSSNEALIPASELAVDPDMVNGNLQVEQVMKQKGKSIGIIQVEIEETLGHYAEWLEIPTRIIRNLNHLPYGRTLRLHKKIKIPLDKISKAQFEEMRFEYHKKIQEDFFSFYEIEGVQIYQLKKGDNIWSLGNDTFDLPVWLIKKYNPDIDFNNLRWSQKIVVPVVKEITDTGATAVQEPSAVPLENLESNPPAKGFWTSFRYFLIVMILISAIAALLYPMIRLQLMILERIKALSELTKHLYASKKDDGDGKSVQLKLIKGKK
ncbi:MAG: transglycosylase SLT domain-containing protein, partial [Desulfobacterales bacterium]